MKPAAPPKQEHTVAMQVAGGIAARWFRSADEKRAQFTHSPRGHYWSGFTLFIP